MKDIRRRRDDRTADIVAAALQEFAANGFAAARLEDVARRAAVSKGTVYLYFDSKEALFRAVVRSAIVPKLEEAETRAAVFEGSAEALLRTLLTRFVREIVETDLREIIRLLIAEAGRFPELADFYHDEVIRRGMAAIRAIVARGVAAGEFRASGLERFPQLVVAPMVMAVVWKALFERREPLDTDALIEAHLDILFAGLRP